MKWSSPVLVVLVVLALLGGMINMHLTRKHTSSATGPAWFADRCTPEDDSAYDCDAVLQTKWSVVSLQPLGFVEPDPDTGRHARGIPVALLGWYYFTGLAVWFAAIGRPSPERRGWHLVPTVTVAAGCATSVFFIYVMFRNIDAKCFWCLMSHLINFLLLIGVLLLWPRKRATPQAPSEAEDSAGAEEGPRHARSAPAATAGPRAERTSRRPHPTLRLVLVTVALAVSLMYAEYSMALRDKYGSELGKYQAKMKEMLTDTDTQVAEYVAQEMVKVEIRPDDPKLGQERFPLRMVVFSDLQCPACRDFAQKLHDGILEDFDGLLQVVWKHYPISKECNPYVGHDLHPQACEAAYAAEAARLQGGNDAFWKAHDYLFTRPELFRSPIDWSHVARELGHDVEQFLADMASDAVKQRVREDIEQAKLAEVKSTPTVYLAGREVKRYMLNHKPFVEEIKDMFLKRRRVILEMRRRQMQQQREQGAAETEEDVLRNPGD